MTTAPGFTWARNLFPAGAAGLQYPTLDAYRAAPVPPDGSLITITNPAMTLVYSATTGAGWADDGATIIRQTATPAGHGAAYPTTASAVAPTLAALRAMVSGKQQIVHVLSHSAYEDEGSGWFHQDPSDSTTADDGGVCVVVNGHRYKRHVDGHYCLSWWGTSGSLSSATSNVAAWYAAWAYLRANGGGELRLPRTYDLPVDARLDTGVVGSITTNVTLKAPASGLDLFYPSQESYNYPRGRIVYTGPATTDPVVRVCNTRRCHFEHLTIITQTCDPTTAVGGQAPTNMAGWGLQVVHDTTQPTPFIANATVTCDENTFIKPTVQVGSIGAILVGLYQTHCAGDCSHTLFDHPYIVSLSQITQLSYCGIYLNGNNAFEIEIRNPNFEGAFSTYTVGVGYGGYSCNYHIVVCNGSLIGHGGTFVGSGLADVYVSPLAGNPLPRVDWTSFESEFSGGPFLIVRKHADTYLTDPTAAERTVIFRQGSHNSSNYPFSVIVDFGQSSLSTQYVTSKHAPVILDGCAFEGALQIITPGSKVVCRDVIFNGPNSALPFGRPNTSRAAGPIVDVTFASNLSLAQGTIIWGDRQINLDRLQDQLIPALATDRILPGPGAHLVPPAFSSSTFGGLPDTYGCAGWGLCRMIVSETATAGSNNLAISLDGGDSWEYQSLPGTAWVGCAMGSKLWVVINAGTFVDPADGGTKMIGISKDQGMTWTFYNTAGVITAAGAIDESTQMIVLIRPGNSGGVNFLYGTPDAGWTTGSTGTSLNARVAALNGNWYVSQNGGSTPVLVSTNKGISWAAAGLSDSGYTYKGIGAHEGVLMCYGYSGGVYHISTVCPGTATSNWYTSVTPAILSDLAGNTGGWFGVYPGGGPNSYATATGVGWLGVG